jgi:hypothetical protein
MAQHAYVLMYAVDMKGIAINGRGMLGYSGGNKTVHKFMGGST